MNTPTDPFQVDLGPTLVHLWRRDPFVSHTGFVQLRERLTLKLIIAGACHPEHAGTTEELATPLILVLVPQFESTSRHPRIGLVWPVGAANDSRFAPGRCSRIP